MKAIAAFYRSSLKSQGWKERPSVINQANMVVMDFSKGGKAFSLTAMQMGPTVKVSADGAGLVMANQKVAAKADGSGASASNESGAKIADEVLEAEPDSPLPVPSKRTMRSIGTGKMPGSDAPFRRELEASVPADAQFGARVLPRRTRQTRLAGDSGRRHRET